MTTFTKEEVAAHNSKESCWLIIDGSVYDVTKFLKFHPAGAEIILGYAGKDATEAFYSFHRNEILAKYKRFIIGEVAGIRKKQNDSLLSPIPHAELKAWQNWASPYLTESHKKWTLALREFLNKEIVPNIDMWERGNKDIPDAVFHKLGAAGILAANLGPGPQLKGAEFVGGVTPEEFDFFHEMILHQEIYRIGAPGVSDGLACGLVIGLPPVFKFGSKELASRVMPEVLSGRKRICLAISEPSAGSDVSGVNCRAVKSACGQFFTVTGVKKWITNGHKSHYFSTAVRTGGKGMKGISLLLIERGPGVTTKKIPTGYSGAAGTSLVIFENVQVPVGNLLGKENQGFKCIMHNFNHERWFIACISTAVARRCIRETIQWAMQRKAFGKPLMSQPVVRGRIGDMLGELEASQSFLENLTYQMCKLDYKKQNALLGGAIAMLKVQTAKMNERVTNECAQLFGGRGLTETGMGKIVFRCRKANQFNGILGGTNEVLSDLAARQIAREFPKGHHQAKL